MMDEAKPSDRFTLLVFGRGGCLACIEGTEMALGARYFTSTSIFKMNCLNTPSRGASKPVTVDGIEGIYPVYVRLPKPPEKCGVSGLCRSTLNLLISGAAPVVKSKVLKQRGAQRGIRLIETASLLGYLKSLPDGGETSVEGGRYE